MIFFLGGGNVRNGPVSAKIKVGLFPHIKKKRKEKQSMLKLAVNKITNLSYYTANIGTRPTVKIKGVNFPPKD